MLNKITAALFAPVVMSFIVASTPMSTSPDYHGVFDSETNISTTEEAPGFENRFVVAEQELQEAPAPAGETNIEPAELPPEDMVDIGEPPLPPQEEIGEPPLPVEPTVGEPPLPIEPTVGEPPLPQEDIGDPIPLPPSEEYKEYYDPASIPPLYDGSDNKVVIPDDKKDPNIPIVPYFENGSEDKAIIPDDRKSPDMFIEIPPLY